MVLRPLVRYVAREVEKEMRGRVVAAVEDRFQRAASRNTLPPDFTERVLRGIRDGEAHQRRHR
jgi:hypothetical protein